jgi:PTS system mannose-specific IIA component
MPYLNHPNIHVITGINLPLVLSLTILPEETKLTKAFILQEIEYAKDQIIYMNDHTIQIDDDDEL